MTTSELARGGRADNLFEAGQGDPGAHGRFDRRARNRAFLFNPAYLRAALAGVAVAAACAYLGNLDWRRKM